MNNNMSIQKDMLNSLLTSSSLEKISNDGQAVNTTKTLLESFNSNKTLEGEEWKLVSRKLSDYNLLFSSRSKVAKHMYTAINSAVKMLLDYLDNDSYLDPSKLEELRETKRRCEEAILNLETLINSKTTETVTLDNGTTSTKTVYIYSESQRNEFRRKINEMKNNVISEINRLIEKIEGLEAVYNEALALLAEAYDDIKNFNNKVVNLVPSNKVAFNPNN